MPRACVLRIEGTNCEDEMKRALENSGIEAELVHLKQLTGDVSPERRRDLFDYQILILPGGWSAGDYVRAGAIFAARIKSKLKDEIKEFVDNGYLVGGICNGFQILIELGLLPGFRGISEYPEAALTNNINSKFQCRAVYLKHISKCAFTEMLERNKILQIPVAHAEGRFTFGQNDKKFLKELIDNNQIVFRYCKENGDDANNEFPWNPNGSLFDIAGICNLEGNVLGMMPHPERAIYRIQMDGWTRAGIRNSEFGMQNVGDGKIIFDSIADYVNRKGL